MSDNHSGFERQPVPLSTTVSTFDLWLFFAVPILGIGHVKALRRYLLLLLEANTADVWPLSESSWSSHRTVALACVCLAYNERNRPDHSYPYCPLCRFFIPALNAGDGTCFLE